MRLSFACLVLLCTALVLPTAAPAALDVGVVDDAPKASLDGGATFFSLLADLGMRENRVTMLWDPTVDRTVDEALLAGILPTAQLRGVRIVLAVYPGKPARSRAPRAPAESSLPISSTSRAPTRT